MAVGNKLRSRWSTATPFLWYCCIVYAFGSLLFGYDVAMFGSLQALPSFLNTFGSDVKGKKALPTERKSIMNSIVWIGKIFGTTLFEPTLERLGFRYTMYIVCVLQIIAVIVEVTAHTWWAFSIGRVIAYLAVGLVENLTPAYAAETAPPNVRPFFSGFIAFLLGIGNLWGNLMGRAFANTQGKVGWIVPTAMQLVPAVALLAGIPTTPESPRWLLAHGKKEQALTNLNRIRPKHDVDEGLTVMEIEALEQSIEEANSRERNSSWLDLFRGTYLRRAVIAQLLFIFQQTTGGQFINVYGATFYVDMGLGSMSFTYTCISAAAGLVAVLIGLYLYANFGRRPILITGAFLQIPFMCLVAGLGEKKNHSQADIHMVIASIILFSCFEKVSLSTSCYIITSEIGGTKMRKKIMSWATSWDVLAAFVVTFSVPYLLGTPGADLGAKVGWIFAGISTLSFLFALFFVPELQGRSLEETDELFEKRLWAWQFSNAKTSGVGAVIAAIEVGEADKYNIPKKIEHDNVRPEDVGSLKGGATHIGYA